MKTIALTLSRRARLAGSALADVLLSSTISSVMIVGMMTATVTLQRSFSATDHHARSQVQQARLVDYMARDLRRALAVTVDTYQGSERLNLTLPDFYDAQGKPRDPAIVKGGIQYGDGTTGVSVSYYKSGGTVYRKVGSVTTALATGVEDFVPDYTDSGKQIVDVSVTFVPRFQLNQRDVSALRLGTATHGTTLLRNKRSQ